MRRNKLVMFFFAGLILRLLLIFFDFGWDVHNHIVWAKDLWARGFDMFYDTPSSEVYASIYPNYPPGALFIFYPLYPLQAIFFKLVWFVNTTIQAFPSKIVFFVERRAFLAGIFKFPAIAADIAIAYLCYRVVQLKNTKDKKIHMLFLSYVLFNPAFFYNSALWGQIDAIPIFFALFALYLAIYARNVFASGICMTIALLIKPTVLLYIPLYAVYIFQQFTKKDIARSLLVSVGVFVVAFVPFFGGALAFFDPFIVYAEKIIATQSLPYVTNGAINFWTLITYFDGIKDTAPFVGGISYRVVGYGVVFILYMFIIFLYLKNTSTKSLFYAFFLTSFASFLFLTKMHERYTLLPLAVLLFACIENIHLRQFFVAFSFISFLNVYHSWPVPQVEVLQKIINNPMVIIGISLINIAAFLYFLKQFYLDSSSGVSRFKR